MWYAMQTYTGKEKQIQNLIEKIVPAGCYSGCHIISYESKRRYGGSWHREKKPMFPGYLFIVAEDPWELVQHLKKIPEMTRLVRAGEYILPLAETEERFVRRLCGDKSLVPISVGVQEGDKIIVKEGPLRGMESYIKKMDRHKRKAYIEVELLGEVRQVAIGLEIVEKK